MSIVSRCCRLVGPSICQRAKCQLANAGASGVQCEHAQPDTGVECGAPAPARSGTKPAEQPCRQRGWQASHAPPGFRPIQRNVQVACHRADPLCARESTIHAVWLQGAGESRFRPMVAHWQTLSTPLPLSLACALETSCMMSQALLQMSSLQKLLGCLHCATCAEHPLDGRGIIASRAICCSDGWVLGQPAKGACWPHEQQLALLTSYTLKQSLGIMADSWCHDGICASLDGTGNLCLIRKSLCWSTVLHPEAHVCPHATCCK